jgi:cold shock CspA family protein
MTETSGWRHLVLADGQTVDVNREPRQDERYGDAWFAINDGFRRTRRMLQDKVARTRGEVKNHLHAPIATVLLLRPQQGYGFLQTADGREVYFHENSVLDGGFSRLTPGIPVTFMEEKGSNGPQASMVRIIDDTGTPAKPSR